MNLLVLRDGIDPRVLEAKIAGRRLEEYISINATPCFSIARRKEPIGVTYAALYVRADAWFTSNAFRALADRLVASATTQVVIVKADGAEILAARLSRHDAKRAFADCKALPAADMLNALPGRLSNGITLGAAELDFEFPPQRAANLLDIARIEKRISFERARAALLEGVRIRDPDRIAIRGELICGQDVEIELDVIIEGNVTLGDGVKVGTGCILRNASIGSNSRINPYSIVEDAAIGADSFVGPYGRIRPGTTIGDRVQIGNFVEVKQSLVGAGSRINHLAFIGDATIGGNVTIGAGVITCNHDGRCVNPTQIGAGAYVGSGTELVAPLSVGENAVIGAGSTITKDAPGGKLTIARSRQVTIENWLQPERGAKEN